MQTILITGANRGLGLEMVRQLAENPTYRIFAACRQVSAELRAIQHVTILPMDVTDQAQITAATSQIDQLDILINNAAIKPHGQSLDSITPEVLLDTLNINAVAPLMLVKALLPQLRRGTNPRIANISSQMGSMDYTRSGGSYAYATSKAALNMITRQLAADLAHYGITTVTIHPGWVQTDMGGRGASLTPEESARGVLQVILNLTHADNGRFFKWNGQIHPW